MADCKSITSRNNEFCSILLNLQTLQPTQIIKEVKLIRRLSMLYTNSYFLQKQDSQLASLCKLTLREMIIIFEALKPNNIQRSSAHNKVNLLHILSLSVTNAKLKSDTKVPTTHLQPQSTTTPNPAPSTPPQPHQHPHSPHFHRLNPSS
jgi:hypothetical protein